MIGAVFYVRVSTKEQTESLSLPTQLPACGLPDPERAPLIARAFEEPATGRFTKQEVIAR